MAKIKIQDVKRAVDIGKEVLPIIEPVIRKHGPEVADKVAKKAVEAGDAVNGARRNALGRIQQRKDSKEAKKALEEARKRAVRNSLPPVAAEEFFENFEANISDPSRLTDGYMAISGCYAILTLKSSREKDLYEYRDVYVGASKSMGFDVYSQLRGLGNVDVYADFKYKQPMKVLLYPCEEGELQAKYEELVYGLQSFHSYNKWDIALSSDEK